MLRWDGDLWGASQAEFDKISNTSPRSIPRFWRINSWQSRERSRINQELLGIQRISYS